MPKIDYVVTFLEMGSAPTRPGPPRPAGAPLALMRAETPPLHFFRYLYGTVGAEYLWVDLLSATDAELADFVQDPKVELTVLHRAGAPAGFFQLDFRSADACNLAYFGLMPEAVGQGVGPWLLRTAIDAAFARGVDRMTVDTCTLDHPKALAMYQRAGFSPIRREERSRDAPASYAPPSSGAGPA